MVQILVVEDSPTQAELLKDMLEHRQYGVTVVPDGKAALDTLQQEMPHIIISDIVMPQLDGYRFCRQIKQSKQFGHIPVILLTALNQSHDVIRGLQCGADNFITKPFNETFLLSRIDYILANQELRNRPSEGQTFEVSFDGAAYHIDANRYQTLDFLLTTYEDAVHKKCELEALNEEIVKTKLALEKANRKLYERVQTQSLHLRASQSNYRMLLENNADAIVVVDPENRVLYNNAAADELFGCTNQELLGATFPFKVELDIFQELNIKRPTGETIVAEMRAEMTFWQGQNCFLASLRDITQRKQMEESLELALAQLKTAQTRIIQQERLRALGQMASGMVHDFNNALLPIIGFSDLLLTQPHIMDETQKLRECLEFIRTAGRDAADMVGRLQNFYRRRDRNELPARSDLNQIVEESIALTRPKWKDQAQLAGRFIQIVTELNETPPVVGTSQEIREILTNLIFNAVDAIAQHGVISISTRHNGDGVTLRITDNGEGMPETVRCCCLEPFFSTKGKQGTGLGLSMVYGIVQRCEGTLNIESTPGQGTTIDVCLPAYNSTTKATPKIETRTIVRGLDILLADDEQMVRNLIKEYLTLDGHNSPQLMARMHWANFKQANLIC